MQDIPFNRGVVKAADCFSDGWELIKSDYGIFFAISTAAIVIQLFLGLVPYAGEVIGAAIAGPLGAGIYYALLQKRRGEDVEFGMLFKRFDRFVPASIVTLISMFPWLLLGLTATLLTGGVPELDPNATPEQLSVFLASFGPPVVAAYLAAMVISFVLWIFLFCALPMIAERDYDFAQAFSLSFRAGLGNFGGLIILGILEGILLFVSIFALCVGFLLALPVVYAANLIAYKKIFPDSQQEEFDEPPQPEFYQNTFGS